VHIVLHDYPSAWPSFFADFLGMLDKGPEVIDVFVRLLKILDEDVVDATQSGGVLGEDRGGGGSSSSSARGNHLRCTAIKDSMRERDLQAIVDAIYSICQLYHNTRPALVASALEAFSEYIEWSVWDDDHLLFAEAPDVLRCTPPSVRHFAHSSCLPRVLACFMCVRTGLTSIWLPMSAS
jgi:hypothetical protein